jgi:hypothetical protein
MGVMLRMRMLPAGHRFSAIYFLREFAAAGGLMSYGGSITETRTVWPASTPGAFSKARNLLTCRSCSPRKVEPYINPRRDRVAALMHVRLLHMLTAGLGTFAT